MSWLWFWTDSSSESTTSALLSSSWSWPLFMTVLSIFVVAMLYQESAAFRYYFKIVIYVLNVSTVALIILPFVIFRPWDVRNVLWGVPMVRPVCRILGLKWKVKNRDILAQDFPCVVVCNHQSILDFLGMVEMWPTMKKCASVAKREILYVFPLGVCSWLSGTVFINRNNAKQSMSMLSKTSEQIRKEKTKLWIFPEGTRSKARDLLPFKKGAFHIAVQNQLPIVPVVYSPYTFVNDEKKIFNHGTVIMSVLQPIETTGMEAGDVGKLTDMVRDVMNEEFHRITAEVQALAGKDAVNTFRVNKSRSSMSQQQQRNGSLSGAKPSATGHA